ncbi:cytochrome c [Chitinophagales bacterium]|nr:cytochrome c [Chitinophagales bacterium]
MNTRTKTALIAVGVMLGFWLLTKGLNSLVRSPGATSYAYNCAQCHGENGEGIGQLVPPLANTDWLEENINQVPCIIRHGIKDSLFVNGVWYNEEMLGLAQLNDIQVANITNYISKRFTKEQTFFTQDKVDELLNACVID